MTTGPWTSPISDARIVLNAAARVCAVSAKALRLLRRSEDEVLGRPLYQAFGEAPDSVFATEPAWALQERSALAFEAYAGQLGRWIELRAEPLPDGGLELLVHDVSSRKQSAQALRQGEERMVHLLRAMADAVWDWDLQADTVWWSEGVQPLLGLAPGSRRSGAREWLDSVHPEDRARMASAVDEALAGSADTWSAQCRVLRADGRVIHVSSRAYLVRDAAGQVRRMVGGVSDVTQHLEADRELARLSRAQRMLSACNAALVRAESEQALLRGVCRLAVEIGGYVMAWVGYARDDAARSIDVAAHASDAADFMRGIPLSWDENGPSGDGPAARCVRSGQMVIVEDIAQDASFAPWLEQALQAGFRGVACLPLNDRGRTFGFFYLYAPDVIRIGHDEIALLKDLANNLAFGIANLRARQRQHRLHDAVLQVAAGVSATSGEAFFQQLARHMALAVGAGAALIGRWRPDQPGTLQSLASVVQDRFVENLAFALQSRVLGDLLQQQTWFADALPPPTPQMLQVLGDFKPTAYAGVRLDDSAGRTIGMLATLFDGPPAEVEMVQSTLQIFAARAAAEIERQEQDRQLRRQASLLDLAQDAIVVFGMDLRVLFWSHGAERLYGWGADAVRRGLRVTRVQADQDAFGQALHDVQARGEWSGELEQQRRDGSSVTVGARWTLVRDDAGAPESILAIHTDITEHKKAEREIQQLAFYDPLTRLPNRLLLTDRLQHALVAGQRSGRGGALLFIDLDNFKTLNDTLGHDMGDLLLHEAASRLTGAVRNSDTVARLGGDEFVVLLEDLGAEPQAVARQARHIGEKILTALSKPYQLAGNEHVSTASIGIAPFHGQHGGVGELLKQADIAMYQAKAAGRHTLRFFDPALEAAVTARAALEADLRQALIQHELRLHYQAQVDAEGRMVGVEALVRWQHPQRGLITPAEFVPLAEENGMILQLGDWVLRHACALLARWAAQPQTAALTVSVNVSSRQFRHPEFVAQCTRALADSGADGQRLKLELTESLLVDDVEATAAKMQTLKAHGIGFALDDFGTGYSSLAYLRRLPLEQLKIDQSFVREAAHDANDAAIVTTIIGLAASLGLQAIAEGVETASQRDFLLREGCRLFQGYLYGQPLTAEALHAALAAGALSPATSTRQS